MTEPALNADGIPPAPSGPNHWPRELDQDYELVGEVGRGGMAVVFRARDRELGRDVAIKVVRPRFAADEEAVGRLAREARTVAQLEHPNIVGVYAIRHLSEGSVALVMQLVPGRTLKSAMAEQGRFDPARAEHVLRDIARALAYAHKSGVVHRDVKPENIFLDEVSGRAMLSDFGVARVMDAPTELTATGTTIGTPTYMAPEQIDGVNLDGRSDLYSLGLVAWEMLTGQRPWSGESLYNVIYRQKHDELPPIDFFRDDVPPRLQYLIEGLMHKSADRRWASAARLLALLATEQSLPGLREWQTAQRRRRRALSHQHSQKRGQSAQNAAQETMKFDREEAAARAAAFAAAEAQAPAAEASTRRVEPAGHTPRPYPRVIVTQTDRRGRLLLAVAAVVMGIAALGLWLISRGGTSTPASAPAAPATLADRPREVPVLPPAAAPLAADSARDSTLAQPAPDSPGVTAALPNAAASRPAPPPADSARVDRRATARSPLDVLDLPPLPKNRSTSAPTRRPDDTPARSASTDTTIAGASTPPVPALALPAPVPTLTFPPEPGLIATGGRHSCRLGESGRALCWGNNDAGQLGDGSFDGRAVPARVEGDFTFAQLAAGGWHTCGVTTSGEVYCWGRNDNGQVGDGTTSARAAPVRVNTSAAFRVVRAGASYSCGLTRAGTVMCWGVNSAGQLGDGTRTSRTSPATVSLPAPAQALAVGSNHTCALTSDGTAYCWGQNRSSQLGDGSSIDRSTPTAVATDSRFVSIAAGQQHTCGVTPNGRAYCWGGNGAGQLGTGQAGGASWPREVDSDVRYAAIVAGYSHTCARTRDGRAWCWGLNTYGQLGDGSTVNRASPVPVNGISTLSVLYAGAAHTCGVTFGGDAYCWGYNIDGQLGGGDKENASAPARVGPPR